MKRLELPRTLDREISTTNAIENLMGSVRELARRVKRWRGRVMIVRWTVTAVAGAAQRSLITRARSHSRFSNEGRVVRYNAAMLWLRRGWLWMIGCALMIAGVSALIIRFDLLDPGPTLAPELFGHALALHGVMSLGVLVAVLLAVPTLVVNPGRGSRVLGFLALGLWVAAIALLVRLELLGAREWAGFSPRGVLLVLAGSLGLGAAQIVVSLPVNADRASRPQLVAACGAIAATAIVVTPLLAGEFPTAVYWMLATTTIACALIPDAIERGARSFALLAIAPCLLLAWAATGLVYIVRTSYFHDTVAMLSPLPVTGGALLNALLLAATRSRSPHDWLLRVATALITAGTSLTSLTFLLLGSRGLPRRYLAYLPEYQSQQILVGVAAAVAVIGAVAALEAFRRGTRADASSGIASRPDVV